MGANNAKTDLNSTDYSSYSSLYEEESPKPLSWKVTVGLTLSIIILVTILGNLLVMIAFATDWRLRVNRGNWFILNLSVADFIIGVTVLPINSAWVVNESWPFGETFCKTWIVVDYTASYVSVLSMVMISLDRYWLVTKKLAYRDFVTKNKVRLMLVSAWLFCVVFYGVVTFLWTVISGDKIIDYSDECEMESVYNLPFNITLIIMEFIVPLIFIVCLNYRIYKIIKIRSKQFVRSKTAPSTPLKRAKNIVEPLPLLETAPSSSHTQKLNGSDNIKDSVRNEGSSTPPSTTMTSPTREKKEFRKHRRAAFTLGVLIAVFIGCWLPYYVTVILGTFCEDCVPESVWEFTNNLLWCNSTLNPFLYALLHSRYRENFIRLLGLKRLHQRWTVSQADMTDTDESTM